MKKKNKTPHVAIIGTRGIPASYGGFETFAEVLSTNLVAKGYKVTVYGRSNAIQWSEPYYKGVKIVLLPTISHKYLDTVVHTFLSVCHVVFTGVNIVYFCNAINSVFMILPRLFRKITIINVDGLEWKRSKWNNMGKFAYKISERLAVLLAHKIISDSKGIQSYYREQYKTDSKFIPYGAEPKKVKNAAEYLKKFNLQPRKYILYVGRLEPENNAHIVIQAHKKSNVSMPLIVVGDAPYGKPYIDMLHSVDDDRIKFFGGVYGEGYSALQNNAYIYIHGHEVGGTNPALLEAMAAGNCVLVNGVDFNKEVIGDSGFWFKHNDVDDLKNKIEYLVAHPKEVNKYRIKATERIKSHYTWDKVVNEYETFFNKLLNSKKKDW